MFGQNEIAEVRPAAQGLLVHSIFYTIQGEGPWAGIPTIFVRFSGCNLRCFFCDTDFAGGGHYTQAGLAAELKQMGDKYNCNRYVLTGGEPMLQDIPGLMNYMDGCYFQIETAGTVWPSGLQLWPQWEIEDVIIVCSPKTPKVHPMIEQYTSYWKYIIREGEQDDDGLPKYSTQRAGLLSRLYRPNPITREGAHLIYVQPCDEGDQRPVANYGNLQACVKAALEHGYRLSIQIHKIAGVD